MNVGQQKAIIRRYGFDDSDPLVAWLNAAMHEIESYEDWLWLEVRVTINALAGASALVLPSTAFKVKSIRDYTNQNKLERFDRTRFDRDIADPDMAGKSEIYIETGLTTVQLWPVLDSDTRFDVTYQAELQDMADDNTVTPPIPVRFHYPMCMGAAYIALMAENEEERAQAAQRQFETSMGRASSKYDARTLDEPDQVVDSQGYGDTWRYRMVP